MENLLVKNQTSEDFRGLCSNKEIDWTDLTSFIINTAVIEEEDMGFLNADDYHNANFEQCNYGTGEEVWDALEKLCGVDMDIIEERFKSVIWEDNDNTAIVTIANKEYAILRM